MKTRNGFVSNSSSSSFIVRRHDFATEKRTTTDKQDLLLKKYGFRKTIVHSPNQVPPFYDRDAWDVQKKILRKKYYRTNFNYGYEILCNQDYVMCFLIDNHISFIADCHYGHETMLYDSKKDVLFIAKNFGAIMECYTVTGDNFLDSTPPVVKMSGLEWAKKNR